MPRNYIRKSSGIKNYDNDSVNEAVQLIIRDKLTYSEASRRTGVPRATIFRYLKSDMKRKRTLFDQNVEENLAKLLERNPYKEHTPLKAILQQVYEFASRLQVKESSVLPSNWCQKRIAGLEWWRGFVKRMNFGDVYVKDAKCPDCKRRIKAANVDFNQCHCCRRYYCSDCFVLSDCRNCYNFMKFDLE